MADLQQVFAEAIKLNRQITQQFMRNTPDNVAQIRFSSFTSSFRCYKGEGVLCVKASPF